MFPQEIKLSLTASWHRRTYLLASAVSTLPTTGILDFEVLYGLDGSDSVLSKILAILSPSVLSCAQGLTTAANKKSPSLFHPKTSLLCKPKRTFRNPEWGCIKRGWKRRRLLGLSRLPLPHPPAQCAVVQDHSTRKKPKKQRWWRILCTCDISIWAFLMVPISTPNSSNQTT